MERSPTLVDLIFEDPWDSRLEQFSYVDYRNCRCIDMISFVFWKFHKHIMHVGMQRLRYHLNDHHD